MPPSQNPTRISSFLHDHNFTVNFTDVKNVVAFNLRTAFIPNGLGLIFRNLENFYYESSNVKKISKENFEGMLALTSLWLDRNEIEKIPQDTFRYLKKLKKLSLSHNKLQSLQNDLLVRLPSLRVFKVNYNQLQGFTDVLFERNEKLEEISFKKNKLMEISMDFQSFDFLRRVDFRSNVCIDVCADENSSDYNCNFKVNELQEEIERMC